tara:strand:- start:4296 stop:4874 length:579 start_codon:yes stop_codon:yes gene_type:complete
MSEKLLRTFLSIPIPNEVRSVKNMFFLSLKNDKSKIRWVRNMQLHLTLKFLGHTPEDEIKKIIEKIRPITEITRPFSLSVSGTGCFPNPNRPRTLWLGVAGDIGPLINLVNEIRNSLDSIGFPSENNDYVPHITMARIQYPQKHTPNVKLFLHSSYDAIDFPADRVQFFSSELLPDGAVYTLLNSFPLGETL